MADVSYAADGRPKPLLMVMHGYNGSKADVAQDVAELAAPRRPESSAGAARGVVAVALHLQLAHPAILVRADGAAGRKAPRERRPRLTQAGPAEEAAARRSRRFRVCWGRSGW